MKLLHDHSRHSFHTQRRRASGHPQHLIARARPAQPVMAITGRRRKSWAEPMPRWNWKPENRQLLYLDRLCPTWIRKNWFRWSSTPARSCRGDARFGQRASTAWFHRRLGGGLDGPHEVNRAVADFIISVNDCFCQ